MIIAGQRRTDIQGLRAIAVLLVVLYHAGLPVNGGFIGVDVFFVISGFVITGTLVRELGSRDTIDLPAFYLRRVRRLLPALAVMLTVVAVGGIFLDPAGAGHMSALTGIFASVFSANYYLYSLPNNYFTVGTQLDPLLHTWSLAVEEQFYLVFPALLLGGWWVGRRIGGPRTGLLMATGAIAVFSMVSYVLASAWSIGLTFGDVHSPLAFGFYGAPARAWEFGLGSVLSLAAQRLRRIPTPMGFVLGACGLSAILVAGIAPGLLPNPLAPRLIPILIPTLGACALLTAGTAGPNAVSRTLGRRIPREIGDLSYSWYLWHWPLIVFAAALFPGSGLAAPMAATISILPAWLSYNYVETPGRFNPRIRGTRVVALAVLCVSVSVVASATLAAAQRVLPVASASAQHADWDRGCNMNQPFGDHSRPQSCTWAAPHARGSIVLIGDSNAGHFTEPVVAAGRRAGFNVTVATLSDCPFVQLRVVALLDEGCPRFDRESLPALVRARPNLVLIAARSDIYVADPSHELAPLSGGALVSDATEKLHLWTSGLRAEAIALNRAGIPVIFVHPIPALPIGSQDCAVVLILVSGCRASLPRSDADRQLRPIVEAENKAVVGLPASSTLSVENELCPQDRCSSRRSGGGLIIYANSNHLTVRGARLLTPIFYRAILTRARPARTLQIRPWVARLTAATR